MRKSILQNKDKLEEAITNSTTIAEVLIYLGLRSAGGNYKNIKKWADIYGLSLPIVSGNSRTVNAIKTNRMDDSLVFCENSKAARQAVKIRLRKMWPVWTCEECGLGETWNGKPITLQLEHKNGIWNDHRLENLCLLCPNCHSQTATFAGRSSIK